MSRTVTLDMDNLATLLEQAAVLVRRCEKYTELPVDVDLGKDRRSSTERAAVNHDLLYLQTLLSTAAGEAGMQYWRMRGRVDPRYDGPED